MLIPYMLLYINAHVTLGYSYTRFIPQAQAFVDLLPGTNAGGLLINQDFSLPTTLPRFTDVADLAARAEELAIALGLPLATELPVYTYIGTEHFIWVVGGPPSYEIIDILTDSGSGSLNLGDTVVTIAKQVNTPPVYNPYICVMFHLAKEFEVYPTARIFLYSPILQVTQSYEVKPKKETNYPLCQFKETGYTKIKKFQRFTLDPLGGGGDPPPANLTINYIAWDLGNLYTPFASIPNGGSWSLIPDTYFTTPGAGTYNFSTVPFDSYYAAFLSLAAALFPGAALLGNAAADTFTIVTGHPVLGDYYQVILQEGSKGDVTNILIRFESI